jgi:hypothetical protein
MFEGFQDSPRLAQTKKDSADLFTVKKALVALLAAAVVFLLQQMLSDTSASSKMGYAVVAWLVIYVASPLAEFGWHYLWAPLRLAEVEVKELQDEKNQLAVTVSEQSRKLFELEAKVAKQQKNQAMADWLTERHAYGIHELLNKKPETTPEVEEWLAKENNFTAGVVDGIKFRGGTPQDVHHVHTLGLIPMYNLHPNPFVSHQLSMLVERLNRIADISTKYAETAAEPALSTGVGPPR